MTRWRRRRVWAWVLLVCWCGTGVGCATVPKNRRGYLTHRGMPGQDRKLKTRSMRKFHTSREAAAGGDGKPAGGGCGCSN